MTAALRAVLFAARHLDVRPYRWQIDAMLNALLGRPLLVQAARRPATRVLSRLINTAVDYDEGYLCDALPGREAHGTG